MMWNLEAMPHQSVSGVDTYDGESGSHVSAISIWSWPYDEESRSHASAIREIITRRPFIYQ